MPLSGLCVCASTVYGFVPSLGQNGLKKARICWNAVCGWLCRWLVVVGRHARAVTVQAVCNNTGYEIVSNVTI